MTFTRYFQQAWINIFAAKMRSFLAVLGILIGTASVVVLISSGEMATQKALAQFKSLGTDLLSVRFYQTNFSVTSNPHNTLKLKDVHEMENTISGIKIISPYIVSYSPINFKGKNIHAGTVGVTENLQNLLKIKIEKGRFISFLDQQMYYCVIGHKVYQKIKSNFHGEIIGQQINIGHTLFTVVGVAAPWSSNNFFNQNINDAILIPLATTQLTNVYARINHLLIQLKSGAKIDRVESSVRQAIQSKHKDIKLTFHSAKEIIAQMKKQQSIFVSLLGLIGGISLLVGGIGVMNVMLVAVSERQSEIGIRRAIGARRKDIRYLFLSEAVCLGLLGGALGIFCGVLISVLIAKVAHWQWHFLLLPTALGFLVSSITGVFFGFYPAQRAAKLDPIKSLRYSL